MIIFPAIDLKNGKVVRLRQGDFNQITEYNEDPFEMAKTIEQSGADWIHIVDLDGAKEKQCKQSDLIIKIAKSVSCSIQTGGGIRTKEDIEKLLNGGISRVVLGTKAVDDPKFLKEVMTLWNDKIAIGLDCKDGMVTKHGWLTTSDISAIDFVKQIEPLGPRCIIYTDVARDGMLTSPNFEALEELASHTSIPIIASGGVSKIEDIKKNDKKLMKN